MDMKTAALPGYEAIGARSYYRPCGTASAGQLADMITAALEAACADGARDALVNVVGMTGFESPGPAFRRWAVRRWAATVRGRLRVAVVARREHISPDKPGLLVAAEETLDANIFENEAEAIAWLDGATAE